ncbi:MAG: bifunctional DNA primase/polymerase [Fuscovulum sp.]|nr:MAG: bifunctional DNA primase/polymerase [Fuscovulum sp.]
MTSPYSLYSDTLRDNGYHVMPAMPGAKIPGSFQNGHWQPLNQWSKWCDDLPPEFIHTRWQDWPDAGICLAHGNVVGLDIDTDRKDVEAAALSAITPSPARKRGAKGWTGYYRAPASIHHSARVRWYDGEKVAVELLLHGTQSVLPPTIHPTTKKPYQWITPDTLESLSIDDLPQLPDDAVDRLDRAFAEIGLKRQAPRKAPVNGATIDPTAPDLEKPLGRSINDRAMEAIDKWWPDLNMPKSRNRGRPGFWEAVPYWRVSNSGRAPQDRNPNLRASPNGIVDFGADVTYTPASLVMVVRDCSYGAAAEWLMPYLRPEPGIDLANFHVPEVQSIPEPEPEPTPEPIPTKSPISPLTKYLDRPSTRPKPRTPTPVSPREFASLFPSDCPPFPIQDFHRDLSGLLRDLTIYIDEAANMRSEQGAFGAALAMLGTILSRKVEISETGLRTNIYVIGTAESGAGKSSAMNAMLRACDEFGVSDRMAGSDFTSGAAILREMDDGKPKLFSIDEFGDVIRRVLNPRAAAHERDIGRILKDMYSSASGVYRGKSYANQDRQDLIEPHLSLYGVSTHEAFWEGIDGKSFNDGLLARFISIPIGMTEPQTPSCGRYDLVADGIKAVCAAGQAKGNLAGAVDVPTPAKLDTVIFCRWMDDRAKYQRYSDHAAKESIPGAPSIINRICENGMKIAMINAAGRMPDAPIITDDDYDLGIAVAHWSAISMMCDIAKYYVENASHKNLKRVLEFIMQGGAKGRSKSEITRAMQGVFVNKTEGDNIISALKAAEQVVEVARQTQTKPVTAYVAAEFVRPD